MRWVTLTLATLILLLQYPLWLGKGGWFRVWDLNRQVEAQKLANLQTQERNAVLDAEVRDLKQGSDAIEERARSELGMIKHDEVFFQVDDILAPASAAAASESPAAHLPPASPLAGGSMAAPLATSSAVADSAAAMSPAANPPLAQAPGTSHANARHGGANPHGAHQRHAQPAPH